MWQEEWGVGHGARETGKLNEESLYIHSGESHRLGGRGRNKELFLYNALSVFRSVSTSPEGMQTWGCGSFWWAIFWITHVLTSPVPYSQGHMSVPVSLSLGRLGLEPLLWASLAPSMVPVPDWITPAYFLICPTSKLCVPCRQALGFPHCWFPFQTQLCSCPYFFYCLIVVSFISSILNMSNCLFQLILLSQVLGS